MIGVTNFGGQYNHLIVRRFREMGVRAEFLDPGLPLDEVNSRYRCLVLSGGSFDLPRDIDRTGRAVTYAAEFKGPVLGICLGMHILAHALGGEVGPGRPEYGPVPVYIEDHNDIFRGLPNRIVAWESHSVEVRRPPPGARVLARSDEVAVQSFKVGNRYGVQFHPEVRHTELGLEVLRNFARICGTV